MDKKLQDPVWSILPKEFKEEVKKEWELTDNAEKLPHDAFLRGKYSMMRELFGHHNLTSDAEGEEMLTCERSKVQKMYAANERIKADFPDKETVHISDHINHVLKLLFGPKCLPDENSSNLDEIGKDIEEKPAEPKFKVGDKVRISSDARISEEFRGRIGMVIGINRPDQRIVDVGGGITPDYFHISHLEPYTEPQPLSQKTAENSNNGNHISIDDNNERRLNIAAMAMQGILSDVELFKNALGTGMETLSGENISFRAVAKASFLFADALIAEAEKGGEKC